MDRHYKLSSVLILFPFLSVIWILLIGMTTIDHGFDSKLPETTKAFIKELEAFMSVGKQKNNLAVFREFEKEIEQGTFDKDQVAIFQSTCQLMWKKKMSANPYFSTYLKAVIASKNIDQDQAKQWAQIVQQELEVIQRSDFRRIKAELIFSQSFFSNQALQYSKSGVSWYVKNADYQFVLEDDRMVLAFKETDLSCTRKNNSINIAKARGKYIPGIQMWKGSSGQVLWPHKKLDNVHAQLFNYQIDVSKSFFKADTVLFFNETIFPGKSISGQLEHKLRMGKNTTEGSYPRFTSFDQLTCNHLGNGILFKGGIKLTGDELQGVGTAESPATITKKSETGKLLFQTSSTHFVLEPTQRIRSTSSSVVLYPYLQDSIAHPAIDFQYFIEDAAVYLKQGKSGAAKSPFIDSYHDMGIESAKIDWYINGDSIVFNQKKIQTGLSSSKVVFKSDNYFDVQQYRRLQNVASYHPVANLGQLAEKNKTTTINIDHFAKSINPNFNKKSILGLLNQLAEDGFIIYHKDATALELLPKAFSATAADMELSDFDHIKIVSEAESTNAVYHLKQEQLLARDVEILELSNYRKVAAKPHKKQLILKKGRDIDFDGRLFSGHSIFEGKDFHFQYDSFCVQMDSIRYLDIFTMSEDSGQEEDAARLGLESRLEHLSGILKIDEANNKSGNEETEKYPIFSSTNGAYVFYDQQNAQDSSYHRDSFYFKINPFTLENVDQLNQQEIAFEGQLFSSGMLPDIQEKLVLREDRSLGFSTNTKEKNISLYNGKGRFQGQLDLSNKGVTADGKINYLNAEINSKDILLKPSELTASADQFQLSKLNDDNRVTPDVEGEDVKISWNPLVDSMYIRSKTAPFNLFDRPGYTVNDLLILTPGGLKARGEFNWNNGAIQSPLFSFGTFSVQADSSNLSIKSANVEELALNTQNVSTNIDFENQIGKVRANVDSSTTILPYNQYETSLNGFDWDMKNETITFLAKNNKSGYFTSLLKKQNGLTFFGKSAEYNLKTSELSIIDVEKILVADAFVIPQDGNLFVQPGGMINTLQGATIIADTMHKYHVIRNAKVDILGRFRYKASGMYAYDIGELKQEILFENIEGDFLGKKKNEVTLTTAQGEIPESQAIFIDPKSRFFGKISMDASNKNLFFDGFAKLDLPHLSDPEWFTLKAEGDRKDLQLSLQNPQNEKGYDLYAGLCLSKETATLYPSVIQPLRYATDRMIFKADGAAKYIRVSNSYQIGDSLKIASGVKYGNLLTYDLGKKEIQLEGEFDLLSNLEYTNCKTAGKTVVSLDDPDKSPVFEWMCGLDINLPEKVAKVMIADLKSSLFDARQINFKENKPFYYKALSEFIDDSKALHHTKAQIPTLGIEFPKVFNPFDILIHNIEMQWDAESQSFYNIRPEIAIGSIQGETINRWLKADISFKMLSNDEDRFYCYLKSPSGFYYYFSFKQGLLSTRSNNPQYNQAVENLGKKEQLVKMGDGEYFEVQLAGETAPQLFQQRAASKAANKR